MTEDLSLLDQAICVTLVTVVILGAFFAGIEIQKKADEEGARAREIEAEAHKYATQGKRASRSLEA